MGGTFSSDISTPRSPRATIMPSADVQDRVDVVHAFRLLDLGDDRHVMAALPDVLAQLRRRLRAVRTNESATMSTRSAEAALADPADLSR